MEAFAKQLEDIFTPTVETVAILIEVLGLIIILVSVVRAFIGFWKKDETAKIGLGHGIMLGLEIKIGAEVLKSSIATSLKELALLGAVIVIRVALTMILHWEVTQGEKEKKEAHE